MPYNRVFDLDASSDFSFFDERYPTPLILQGDDSFCEALNSYTRYLHTLSLSFDSAKWLHVYLKPFVDIFNRELSLGRMEPSHPNRTIASIIDFNADNTMRQAAQLKLHDLANTDRRVGAVETFRNRLLDASEAPHTRVVVCSSAEELLADTVFTKYDVEPLRSALSILLLVLVFGVDFDLDPDLILRLLGLQLKEGTRAESNFSILPQHVISLPNSRCQALWRGRQRLGAHQPFTVLVSIDAYPTCSQRRNFLWGRAPSLSAEQKSPSQVPSAATSTFARGNLDFFLELLENGSWSFTSTIMTQARAHWLSALLRIEYETYWLAYGYPSADTARIKQGEDSSFIENLLKSSQSFALALSLTQEQVMALREDVPELDLRDASAEVRAIGRLIDRASSLREHVKTRLDIEIGARNLKMTELAIEETRSGMTLTILAFIFVPISLASSIFGMNVQQINDTGHDMWNFVVLSFAMLTLACLAWLICRAAIRARSNWRHLSRYMQAKNANVEGTRVYKFKSTKAIRKLDRTIEKQQQEVRVTDGGVMKDRAKRWACYLGLMPLEKLGIEPRDLPVDEVWYPSTKHMYE